MNNGATLLIAVLLVVASRAAPAADWPQLQNGPQRHGYSTEKLQLPLRQAWSVSFVPERIHPGNQPIVYQGRLYIGTQSGRLHALDASTGRSVWTAGDAGPILGPAAADNGHVFYGSLDGNVYAVRAADGAKAWHFTSNLDTGFSSGLALADGRLYAANRGGIVFALDPATGREVWRCDLGTPLLMSPAVLPAGARQPGLLVIGGMDMRVHAVETAGGRIAWRSEQLYGQALKDYWPVIYRDKVIVRSMINSVKPKVSSRTRFYSPENYPLTWGDPLPDPAWRYPDANGPAIAQKWGQWYREHSDEVAAGKIPREVDEAQDRVAAEYLARPQGKDMFVLDLADGRESIVTPHWCAQTMNGATSPPCVDRDGLLVVPLMYINSRWARFDLSRNRVVDILYDGLTYSGQKVSELTRPGWYPIAGGGNTDENLIVSAAGDLIFSFHCQEANANYTGVWDMNARRWSSLMRGERSGPYVNNTQGGGASAAVTANGMVYHLSFHTITAWASR
jgi:hypothetical protein